MTTTRPTPSHSRQAPVPRERSHTLFFLDRIREFSPVHLDTEIDMTAVRAHRAAARAADRRFSVVSYVLHSAGRVLGGHPAANAAVRGGWRPRLAYFDTVNGKVTLDKKVGGERVVVSTVLRGLATAELETIQRDVDHFRDGDPDTMPEFAAMRSLHRLPRPLGRLAFRLGVRPLARRADTMGTFAVTSLGHRPVDGFHSVGGTTVTLGVGRIADRPVVRDGAVTIAPVMRLNLTFDHRVIDGAEAADVLGEIKERLEKFPPYDGGLVPATTAPEGS
ncbi:2-oxo acid dehydrogenase subunit E2 [Micromonospora endolithica]|uniref:Acyltransferase n=1 Tax=Micromonospora endolithica TaxID=230091 RepID=A0A3A9ZRP8_9ACTN|nr:2-oxo acid dehydrogenase subunit E2 [Micromonospora endolithica]RKN50256.1 acyltransferase [Micromonospora endolithica]TWJ21103.1 2-oxoacid dehydrogenase/acyltransferase catalytic subunit [Micromonospora endolithica]